ncbi:MAG: HAMP domain-containing histidine kinase, partial [Myxococcales bacterium]|nr:HAMP domain-containing histidine kinase [Myxococcales bacterium]
MGQHRTRDDTEEGAAQRFAALGAALPVVVHELGGALNRVSLYDQLLERKIRAGATPDELAPSLERLREAIGSMERTLAAVHRANAAVAEPDGSFEVGDLLRGLEAALEARASQQGVELVLDLPSTRAWMVGRCHRLERALVGLVDNALDAMPRGGRLVVQLRVVDARVEIAISDSGPGIPESIDPLLPFSSTKAQLGIGLPFARHVARQHGGDLSVVTAPEGTTVTLSLVGAAPSKESDVPTRA